MFRAPALRPSWPYVSEVARSLVGVLLAVAAALHWGSGHSVAGAALAAGGSAAIAGTIALQDSPHGRLPLVIGVSFGLGLAALIGALSAPHTVIAVAVVVGWCFAAGLLWAISANAGLVAAAASVLVVAAPAGSGSLAEALTCAVLAVLGGFIQAVLVAAWPRQRWRTQGRALAGAYQWVADSARRVAFDPGATLDPTPLIELRDAFALTEHQARRRPQAHRGVHALPERIAMTLNALRSEADSPMVRDSLLASADVLGAVAAPGGSARTDAELALTRVTDCVDALQGPVAPAAQRLRAQVSEAAAVGFAARPGVAGSVRAAREAVARHWSGDSPILRHAVRLAVAVGTGAVITKFTGVTEGYWIALTALLVLRPETAHTYTRCVTRALGALAGIAVASGITLLWHPTGLIAAVLAVALLGLAHVVAGLGYLPLTAALAAGLVFLLDIGGTPDSTAIGQRVVAAVLGGGLAVVSHVVLPDRSMVRLRQRAGELLKAEIDYAATVVRGFAHELTNPEEVLSASWQRVTRARSAFEAASGSVRDEAPRVRSWLTVYRSTLNAVTAACATLEAHLEDARPETLDPRFVVAVDDYVDALRGETPTAGQAWSVDARHLTEADQQLRDAAALLGKQDTARRVLVVETETITRQLLAVAAESL